MKKLFFVETKQTHADQLSRHLNGEYQVIHFPNAKSCLDTVKQLKRENEEMPDVVIIDHNLPDLKGVKLFKKLQQSAEDTNLLLMVPRENSDLLFELIQSGIVNYVIKDKSVVKTLLAVIERRMQVALV
jgi:DNA-binding NtrC family response regulator